jgi:hypothetical protein
MNKPIMTKELVDALTIAGVVLTLWGVILPILLYHWTNRLMTKMETQKLRVAARTIYETKLFEKRLDAYQSLFPLLSKFIKKIEFGSVLKDDIGKFLDAINEWDSKYAVFLSKLSADVCYEFRHELYDFAGADDARTSKLLSLKGFLEELRNRTAAVELALRSDLGIYGIRPSKSNIYEVDTVRSIQELVAKSQKEFSSTRKKLIDY